jgi:hypothetical protein
MSTRCQSPIPLNLSHSRPSIFFAGLADYLPETAKLDSETEKQARRRSKPDRIFSPAGAPHALGCTQNSAILQKDARNSQFLTTLPSNRFVFNGLTDAPRELNSIK